MIVYLLFVILPLSILWCLRYLDRSRRLHDDLPSLPRNFLFGNLLQLGRYMKGNRHPDYGMEQIYYDLDEPEIFVLDTAPATFAPTVVVIAAPSIAEQISKSSKTFPWSVPKSHTMEDMKPLIGKSSLSAISGEKWVRLRKQFSPGFQPTHLQSFLPTIIEQVKLFNSNLLKMSHSGEVFMLRTLTTSLTADIISSVVFGEGLHAQTTENNTGIKGSQGLITAFEAIQKGIAEAQPVGIGIPNPIRMLRQAYYQRILREGVKMRIKKAFNQPEKISSRNIISLALQGQDLTPAALEETADQVQTFLFAGYDTTSTLLQWILYYISKPQNADVMKDLRVEHEEALGTDVATIEANLLKNPPLSLTMAVIKETLRLRPPAATGRYAPSSGPPLIVQLADGTQSKPLNGTILYHCHHIMHNSAKIWGDDVRTFRPSRWLDEEYMKTIPIGAYRPFERGPRDCIGRELAMLEAKVTLVLTISKFGFVKVSEQENDLGDVWNIFRITSSPNDGMRMRVFEKPDTK